MDSDAFFENLDQIASPLSEPSDLQPLIEKLKAKKIVMLGESTHGTQEFYEYRKALSLELIRNHGFDFISVEGDWPACQSIDQYIKNDSIEESIEVITKFSRWPTWMWGNTETIDLMEELKKLNYGREKQIGFHGLDVYSIYESMDEVIHKLNQIDPILALKAKHLYGCFDAFKHDEKAYARSLFNYPDGCEQKVVKALESILDSKLKDQDLYFDIVQNARIVKNAERYYHTMISQEEDSWNVRDTHMMDTLDMLLNHYGPDAKAIVWAHNTHIGDYKATDMVTYGQINLGGLARERYGVDEVSLVGFTTFTGQVVASHAWDGPIEVMDVPRAKDPSLEHELHEYSTKTGEANFILDFDAIEGYSPLNEFIGHRAIGVVYHPEHEHRGNYVPTIPAQRYNAMVFFDETTSLTPLNVAFQNDKVPETFPYGDRI